jgi:4-carboxymuconolactone decarboxylase
MGNIRFDTRDCMIRIISAVLALTAPAMARAQDGLTIVRGTEPAGPAAVSNFTGIARVGNWFQAAAPARIYGATVAFEPGARTYWHRHPLGQILVITAGTGRVQHWGGPVQEVRPGDVVHFPPGVKHWHGASPTAAMTHVALVETPADGSSTNWLEPVTEEQYTARLAPVAGRPAEPDAAVTRSGVNE